MPGVDGRSRTGSCCASWTTRGTSDACSAAPAPNHCVSRALSRTDGYSAVETTTSTRNVPYSSGAAERKNSGGLKGSEGETRIRVEGGVLLGGRILAKAVIGF